MPSSQTHRDSLSGPRDPLQPDMVEIPAGPFIIGTDAGEIRRLCQQAHRDRVEWYAREQPAHTLDLPDYRIARWPVTVGEMAEFVRSGGYYRKAYWSAEGWTWRKLNRVNCPEYWDEKPWSGRDDLPVVGVSWYAAQAYCAWLRAETGLPYRLPTEAEWEKAARGIDGRRYPWGDTWESRRCNAAKQPSDSWDIHHQSGLAPVGYFSPQGDSPYGCADMAGNIWEWCATPMARYPLAEIRTAAPDSSTEPRIVRGGSWYHGPDDARCAARYCYYPHGQDNVVGFRLAL